MWAENTAHISLYNLGQFTVQRGNFLKKVAVYAICKNESHFVDRWMDSMGEADEIVVLDTISTDDTVSRLQSRGAHVQTESIVPWRFDVARNRSLALVSTDADICVCTDLDEVFHPGWRSALEQAWLPGTQQARYRYTWSFEPDGREGVVFWSEKIHSRHGWRWIHPVHEVLSRTDGAESWQTVTAEGVQLDHHPDHQKSRGQYLPLLELSVQESPEDDRNWHYLGREYFFYGRWDDCIRTLLHHLTLPTARWPDERAASMRYIAKSYLQKGNHTAVEHWFLRAILEAPHLREGYTDLAFLLYRQEDWPGVLHFTTQALNIRERPRTYICEAAAWGSLPHDLRAIAWHHLGRNDLALNEARAALALSPNDARLRGNVAFFEAKQKDR